MPFQSDFTEHNVSTMRAFFRHPDVRRVVGHMEGVRLPLLQLNPSHALEAVGDMFCPEVMQQGRALNAELGLNDLFNDPDSAEPPINYAFAAMTFNLGPQVDLCFEGGMRAQRPFRR